MSKEGPFPDFDKNLGGKFHLHSEGELGSELVTFLEEGSGAIVRVGGRSYKIVDYCPDGVHYHEYGGRIDGGNVALKPIMELKL